MYNERIQIIQNRILKLLVIVNIILGITTLIINKNTFIITIIISFIIVLYLIIKLKTINIMIIFLLSFIYLIGGEYILIQSEKYMINYDTLNSVTAYFQLTLAMIMLCYTMLVNNLSKRVKLMVSDKNIYSKYYYFIWTIQILAIILLFVRYGGFSILNYYRLHRMTGASDAAYIGLILSLLFKFAIVSPIIYFFIRRINNNKVGVIYFIVSVIIAVIFVIYSGTRYYWGLLILSILYYNIKSLIKIRKRYLFIIILFGYLVILGSTMLKYTRQYGVMNISADDVKEQAVSYRNLFTNEGMLYFNSLIIEKQEEGFPLSYGKENLFILYFWVPRDLWESKPYMADYWVIREITSENYDPAFSISGGYPFNALIDFGYWGGIIFSFLYGFIIIFAEILYYNFRNLKYNPIGMSVPILFFSVFFYVRSPQTGLIIFLTFTVLLVLPYYIVYKHAIRKL